MDKLAIADKQPITKEQIELLLITELQACPGCEGAIGVAVVAVRDWSLGHSWTVNGFNPGRSCDESCNRALQHIVPRLQRAYDMVQLH
jgi:hypothetical protein